MSEALEIGKSIAKPFEGLQFKPYLCSAGVPTIGYGTTRYPDGRKVKMTDPPITIERAEELLEWEMGKSVSAALRHCPVLLLEDAAKWGAIADFVYNLGAGRLQNSTLRRRINQRNWLESVRELQKWVYGGGRKLRGLVLRREAEAMLMNLGG